MANCEASANSQAAMQRLKDELSDDEKNGNIGKIITYIPDLCQTGWSFREACQNLGKLSTLGRHLEKVGRPVTRGVPGVRSHPPTGSKGPHFDTQYLS